LARILAVLQPASAQLAAPNQSANKLAHSKYVAVFVEWCTKHEMCSFVFVVLILSVDGRRPGAKRLDSGDFTAGSGG
jgi:hypothetical protein